MTADHVVEVDLERSLVEDPRSGHNRWHPGIAPIMTIRPGEVVRVDLRDGLDHQITRASTDRDILDMDMLRGHPLSGPFLVEGARAGDLVEIEILSIEHHGFGFTCVRPGAGLLAAHVPGPFLATWELAEGRATSPQIPGVTVPADPFLGIVGVAPSPERMREYAAREEALARPGGAVLPPTQQSAIPLDAGIASVGLRTVPPRENGGNLDAKYLRAGSRLLVLAQVDGALVSLGDAHYAQGHGEVCSQAIEMSATVEFTCRVRPRDAQSWRPTMPVILSAPAPAPQRRLVTTGIPVEADGTNRSMDLNVAALNALLAMQDYLTSERGLSAEQAYALSSVAVDLEILEIVNGANVLVGAAVDLTIFDDDRDGVARPTGRGTDDARR
ncbi:acetamidase/formamidase family protein [Nostocoides sp. HKS02]|uniref:acetamidase/formamidase family protein n=1 Tax=Nostocoides sp. HKS02 TaxID=1813880 RepID=UPI0018A84BA2|nr:acetamidase/formamidase family protein [Tetrasphaera sp. HKS02]